MLCPEVWDFKAPQHYFKVVESNDLKSNATDVIKKHYFNHSVFLVIPDNVTLPQHFFQSLHEDNDYYRVNNLPPSVLIDKEFIEAFVKTGKVNVLSIENRIDTENLLAISPSGHLILSLVKEDFQQLGIEGKASFFNRNIIKRFEQFVIYIYNKHVYLLYNLWIWLLFLITGKLLCATVVVTIDLKEESFTPGKKRYERVKLCLANNLRQNFNVIINWNPPEEKLCPSSVAAWFHKRGYEVKLCKQQRIDREENYLRIPVIDENTDKTKLFEWLGVLSIGGDLFTSEDNSYVNRYKYSELSAEIEKVNCIRLTGFLTNEQVEKIFLKLRSYIKERQTIPWIGFDVQGFTDSPISWGLKEHDFFIDGDNSYAVFIKPDDKCLIRTSLSSNNKTRISQ